MTFAGHSCAFECAAFGFGEAAAVCVKNESPGFSKNLLLPIIVLRARVFDAWVNHATYEFKINKTKRLSL